MCMQYVLIKQQMFFEGKINAFNKTQIALDIFVHQNKNEKISFPNKKRIMAASNADLACTKQRSEM